jgi:hypothetical protein
MQENGSKMFEFNSENCNFYLLIDGIDQFISRFLGVSRGHVAQTPAPHLLHGFFKFF